MDANADTCERIADPPLSLRDEGKREERRKGKAKRGNERKRKSKADAWDPKKTRRYQGRDDGREGWERFPLSNVAFEEYYREQGIVSKEEWESFLDCLKQRLPATFRINGSGKYASFLKKKLKEKLVAGLEGQTIDLEGKSLQPPTSIPWYPDELAWRIDCSRNQIRKVPVLAEIHEFLKRENDIGSISRQEEVSMIPPILLDVQPQHWVLDMCAAPGSKTLQLLESVQGTEGRPSTGLVVANDADMKRCNLLIHQTKRMNCPCLVVTNHEGQSFPMLRSNADEGIRQLRFDRILCDVPCSGDGTMRKAPDLWRRWTPGSANGLHPLQLKIAKRAVQLLKVGGRMVYSTCSLNPVENEAVVAALLKQCHDCLRIVQTNDQLGSLKRCPGMPTWKVRGKKAGSKWYSNWNEVDTKDPGCGGLVETMFPPSSEDGMALEQCIRILPHHGDTGAFFITVLEKVAELPGSNHHASRKARGDPTRTPLDKDGIVQEQAVQSELPGSDPIPSDVAGNGTAFPTDQNPRETVEEVIKENAPSNKTENVSSGEKNSSDPPEEKKPEALKERIEPGESRPQQKCRQKHRGIDPIVPVTDLDLIGSIDDFYGFASLPLPLCESLICRIPDAAVPKKLYYISRAVRELMEMDTRGSLRVFSVGVKAFERQVVKDGQVACKYRLAQDSVRFLSPFITKQRISLGVRDFQLLLQHRCLLTASNETSAMPQLADPIALEELRSESCSMGTCLVSIRLEESLNTMVDCGLSLQEFTVTAWKGAKSINLLVGAMESSKLLDAMVDQFGLPPLAKSTSKSTGADQVDVAEEDTATA